jgi:hypothetical protein
MDTKTHYSSAVKHTRKYALEMRAAEFMSLG